MKSFWIAGMMTLIVSAPLHASSHFLVRMNVAGDSEIKSQIEIGMARVFSSFPDIDVVDAKNDWLIEVVSAPIRIGTQQKGLIALSVVIGTTEQNRALVESLNFYFKDSGVKSKFQELVSDNYVILRHEIQVVKEDEVGVKASDIIREFNREFLEPLRKKS